MDPRLAPLNDLLHLNTRLFLNCLEGLDDTVARRSPGGNANSPALIALHLVDARFGLAAAAGAKMSSAYSGISEKEPERFPPIAELRTAWNEASAAVAQRMAEISPADLAAVSPRRFPVADRSLLGAIAFLVQHESYHIGQLSYVRRLLELPPMSYREQR